MFMFEDETAEGFFKWCLKLDPDHRLCRNSLKSMKKQVGAAQQGNAHFRVGDFEEALSIYAKSIQAMPGHCLQIALIHLQRCRCLIYMDDAKAAMRESRFRPHKPYTGSCVFE